MKVFISQLMRGRTQDEIRAERIQIERRVLERYPNAEFIDSILAPDRYSGLQGNQQPLWCLGDSLKLLAHADLMVLGKDARSGRGCVIEIACANAYGIPILEDE